MRIHKFSICIIVIIIVILWYFYYYSSFAEQFQYILDKDTGEFKAKEYIRTTDKNQMLTIPSNTLCKCTELCKMTPKCSGINYYIDECTLYKQLY